MRKLSRFVMVCALLSFAAVGTISVVGAQDTATTIQCDSDLTLNLYIAERFFNFNGVRERMMQNGADSTAMVDLTLIDRGQYTPWFDSAMANMTATTSGSAMTEEQVQGLSDMLMLDDVSRQQMMSSAMPSVDMTTLTVLPAPVMTGELPECAGLRMELNRFFTAIAFNDITGMTAAPADTITSTTTDTTGTVVGDPLSWTTALSGLAEVPGPGDPDGTGSASITIDSANSQVCYTLFVQNLTLPAQAAHIHRGAAGEPGDVVVPFDIAPDATGNAVSCVVVDAALLAEIAQNPTGFYVNVHTSDFPDGAVRGQVLGS
jgi:hypothetical protein